LIDALHAFGLEDLLAAPVHSNGHAMGACAGCGEPVALRKGAARLWCSKVECKRAAGALRAKELRERRSKIPT
jgi:hypothetical protein